MFFSTIVNAITDLTICKLLYMFNQRQALCMPHSPGSLLELGWLVPGTDGRVIFLSFSCSGDVILSGWTGVKVRGDCGVPGELHSESYDLDRVLSEGFIFVSMWLIPCLLSFSKCCLTRLSCRFCCLPEDLARWSGDTISSSAEL